MAFKSFQESDKGVTTYLTDYLTASNNPIRPMTEIRKNDRSGDTSDVKSLLETIDQLYQVSCSVLNDHTQTSLRMAIAIEAQMLLLKLQAMHRRWKIHLPFKEACQVEFFDWAERMSAISREIAASASEDVQRRFEKYCPSKHFLLDLYDVLTDKEETKEKAYYEEVDTKKFIERQELMRTYIADCWKEYVTQVSDRTVEELASRGDADIVLSSDASYVQMICCNVLEDLSDILYALNQRLTTQISRKDFKRLAERILIESDYGGNYALRKAKAKVNTWYNRTPYDQMEIERDKMIQETIAEIEKTKFGGQFMQNVKIFKDFESQLDSFGKFLFSERRDMTKEDLSRLFELIFRIYHLRRLPEQVDHEEREPEDTKPTTQVYERLSPTDAGNKNPPLPVEFSQNFRSNDRAVAKFYELLRKIGPYVNRKKKRPEEGTAAAKYGSWKWMHLEDALIKLKLLVSTTGKRTFSDFIHDVFPDRSSDSVYRALYRTDSATYHSTVGDIVRFFQPVKDIVDHDLQNS